jgi:hypothetical protein
MLAGQDDWVVEGFVVAVGAKLRLIPFWLRFGGR